MVDSEGAQKLVVGGESITVGDNNVGRTVNCSGLELMVRSLLCQCGPRVVVTGPKILLALLQYPVDPKGGETKGQNKESLHWQSNKYCGKTISGQF